MESLGNDLFILMANLSQINNIKHLTTHFIEGLNNVFKPVKFNWSTELDKNSLEIKNSVNHLGYISVSEKINQKQLPLFQHAIQVFVVYTERIQLLEGLDNKDKTLDGIGVENTMQLMVETENQREENELREKEVQYHNLANTGLALIWTAGIDKLCNYFNNPWLQFTGRSLEQELGNGWTEGVHPDDFNECLNTYLTAFDKHQAFEMEYRLRHASGDYRWILDMGSPNFNSKGEFIGYIGHCFDISERKLTEEALLKNNSRLEMAMNAANMAWWEMNLETGLVNFEKRKAEMLGYPPERFKHYTDFMALVHPNDAESAMNAMSNHLYGKTDKYEIEYRILTQSGEYKWFYDLGSVVQKDAEGKPQLITGLVLDVSSRKLVELKLHSQNILLTALINSPKDLIIFSLDKNYCYTAFNENHFAEMKQVWGVEIEPGMNLLDCMQIPELKEMAKGSIDRVLQGETISEINHQPGVNIYYEFSWNPIWENDMVIGVTVFIKNITKRMQQTAEQNRLLHILESSLNEIYVFDSKNLAFEYVNQAALQNLGYSFESMKTMSPFHLKPHFTELQFRQLIEPLLNLQKKQLVFVTEHLRANGSLYPVEVHLQLVENEGQQLFLAVIMDITERKKADQKNASQLDELQRWQKVTLGREDRNRQLKKEVNELLSRLGEKIRYPSQDG